MVKIYKIVRDVPRITRYSNDVDEMLRNLILQHLETVLKMFLSEFEMLRFDLRSIDFVYSMGLSCIQKNQVFSRWKVL